MVFCFLKNLSVFSFCLDTKRNKKVKEKRMLRLFSSPRTKTPNKYMSFSVGMVVVQDPAACYAGQRKVLCSALTSLEQYAFIQYGGTRHWKRLTMRTIRHGRMQGTMIVVMQLGSKKIVNKKAIQIDLDGF